MLDVGSDYIWGVNTQDENLYVRSAPAADPSQEPWVYVRGGVKHVSVSPAGHVWIITSTGIQNKSYLCV